MFVSLFTTGIYGYLALILLGWTLALVWLAARALVMGSVKDFSHFGL